MMKRLVLSYYGVKQVNLYYKIDIIYLSYITDKIHWLWKHRFPPPRMCLEVVLLRARVAGSTLFDQRLTTCGESQRSAA